MPSIPRDQPPVPQSGAHLSQATQNSIQSRYRLLSPENLAALKNIRLDPKTGRLVFGAEKTQQKTKGFLARMAESFRQHLTWGKKAKQLKSPRASDAVNSVRKTADEVQREINNTVAFCKKECLSQLKDFNKDKTSKTRETNQTFKIPIEGLPVFRDQEVISKYLLMSGLKKSFTDQEKKEYNISNISIEENKICFKVTNIPKVEEGFIREMNLGRNKIDVFDNRDNVVLPTQETPDYNDVSLLAKNKSDELGINLSSSHTNLGGGLVINKADIPETIKKLEGRNDPFSISLKHHLWKINQTSEEDVKSIIKEGKIQQGKRPTDYLNNPLLSYHLKEKGYSINIEGKVVKIKT